MALNTASAPSDLVYTQYALCAHATDLSTALRDLRRLRRVKCPGVALDRVVDRLARLRSSIHDEINGIDEMLSPRRSPGLGVCA